MLYYQTSWRVCVDLEVIWALVKGVKRHKSQCIHLFPCKVEWCCLWSLCGLENSVRTGATTLLSSADLCCSLVSFLVSDYCTLTLLIGKIAYSFISLGGFGWRFGVFFWLISMRKYRGYLRFFFPFSSPPNETYPSFCLLSDVTLLYIWDVTLDPVSALSCVSLMLS